MLSSVPQGDRAVKVNIAIMRAFARTSRAPRSPQRSRAAIEALERKDAEHDARFRTVFEAIHELASDTPKPRRGIGFKPGEV